MDNTKGESEEAHAYRRQLKLTAKAMEEMLNRSVRTRKGKLGQLTGKMNEINYLMEDDGNYHTIKPKLADFKDVLLDFSEINESVKGLMEQLSVQDSSDDQRVWYEPKAGAFREFIEKTEAWALEVHNRMEQAKLCDEEVTPRDSISVVTSSVRRNKRQGSVSGRSSQASSSASSARLRAEVERVTLEAKAAALKKKHDLDRQEAQIKAQREELEMQTAIEASKAKIKVLEEFEAFQAPPIGPNHRTSSYLELKIAPAMEQERNSDLEEGLIEPQYQLQPPHQQTLTSPTLATATKAEQQTSFRPSQPTSPVQNKDNVTDSLYSVMQRQNTITEGLLKQQRMSTLPPLDIPIFKGDPMEYKLFLRAFEHGIEDRTESSKDRIYFLEQYTNGQPRELVRSCIHMDPERGYPEAKRLLKEHFGNEYTIAVAYIDKALTWSSIKPEDGEALHSYALFLTGCCNAMMDVDYLEELNHAANMQAIIARLPYKLRERWRGVAFDIQERQGQRAKFKDLVSFVSKQAKISLHPLFGDIKDSVAVKAPVKSHDSSHPGRNSTRKASPPMLHRWTAR